MLHEYYAECYTRRTSHQEYWYYRIPAHCVQPGEFVWCRFDWFDGVEFDVNYSDLWTTRPRKVKRIETDDKFRTVRFCLKGILVGGWCDPILGEKLVLVDAEFNKLYPRGGRRLHNDDGTPATL